MVLQKGGRHLHAMAGYMGGAAVLRDRGSHSPEVLARLQTCGRSGRLYEWFSSATGQDPGKDARTPYVWVHPT